MIDLLAVALLLLSVVLAVPVGVFTLQVIAGCLPPKSSPERRAAAPRPRLAVLIPAHNEAAGLGATLASLAPQLVAGDRVLVVADNCSDSTADVARAAGASVTERSHATQRGKGYALDHGL
ncbi:MAG: glycosyltransferase, partial [Methylibium sp.]|nr:glycosyltransferase [Methylibium sp.]